MLDGRWGQLIFALRDSGETGALAALQAVAQRLGDGTFEGLFHKVKARQFCLKPVTPQFMLLSVFEAPVRFAIVKACASKAILRFQCQIEAMPIATRNTTPPTRPPRRLRLRSHRAVQSGLRKDGDLRPGKNCGRIPLKAAVAFEQTRREPQATTQRTQNQ